MASLLLFNYTHHHELWAPAQQCGVFPLHCLPCWGQMAFLLWLEQGAHNWVRAEEGNNLMVLISCIGWCSPLTALNLSAGKPLPCLDKFPCAMILSFWACWKQVACLCDDSSPAIILHLLPHPTTEMVLLEMSWFVLLGLWGQDAQWKPSSLGYSAFLGLMDRIWRSIAELG